MIFLFITLKVFHFP